MAGPKSNGWWEGETRRRGINFRGKLEAKWDVDGEGERGIRVNNNGTRHTRYSPAQQAMEKAHSRMRSRTMATYFQSSAN